MTLNELKYMVAVAEEKHFGRAAQRCFVSQPTLSVAIKKLEEELGVNLFERTKNEVILTEKAHLVYQEAVSMLGIAARIKHISMSADDELSSSLPIGIIYTIAPYLLPSLIPALKRDAPEMPLIIEEDYTGVLRESLKTGKVDAIIVALPFSEPGMETLPLYEEDFLALMPNTHPLSSKQKLSGKDLASHKVLMLGQGHCFREQVLNACPELDPRQNGEHDMQKTLVGSSLETIRHMVLSGVGVTVLPRASAVESTRGVDDLITRPLVSNAAKRTIAIAWRKGYTRKAALKVLIESIHASSLLRLHGINPLAIDTRKLR